MKEWTTGGVRVSLCSLRLAVIRLREVATFVNELKPLNDVELLREYVNQAVWHWFEPSTHEMGIETGFHRLAARCLLLEMRQRGLEEPTDEMLFGRARRVFPMDDLRRE